MTRTENLLEEAEKLLAMHKQEMEDDPGSFAHRLAYKSLLNHVQYLRIQVMRAEMTQAEKALQGAIKEFDKAVIKYAENQGNLEFRAIYEFYQELIEHLKKRLTEEEEIRRVVREMLDDTKENEQPSVIADRVLDLMHKQAEREGKALAQIGAMFPVINAAREVISHFREGQKCDRDDYSMPCGPIFRLKQALDQWDKEAEQ